MNQRLSMAQEAAEGLAIQALTFIAQDGERLGRFLAVTGIGPSEIRAAAHEPGFLAGVLDYVAADQRLMESFAVETGLDPAEIDKARHALGGDTWERENP